jgi:hypothetical protein
MGLTRKSFTKGIMDKDSDERLFQEGTLRHAENIQVVTSEGSDTGSVQNCYSTKQLTNLDLGINPKSCLGFSDEKNDKLYHFVKSDSGCFLIEWDDRQQIASFVLKDTRAVGSRVLDLDENFLITGIGKIITDDFKKDLLLWTDDNTQPCCINIERAKTYGENGFEKEDIFLVKKPPLYTPTTTPYYTNDRSNNIEEKFLTFSYRYKYLDGEYSALSDFTNYKFSPRAFDLDFFTLENKGMVNAFNGVKIDFNTGEKQVTDIELCVKESNSINIYVIQGFNKKKEGWVNNQSQNYIFSNSKLYSLLPSTELYRASDQVPLKAKSLTLIGNKAVFGNYEEGQDLVDVNGKDIKIDYSVSMYNELIDDGNDFTITTPTTKKFTFENLDNVPLTKGKQLNFYFDILLNNIPVYRKDFFFILTNDYANLELLTASLEFQNFVTVINSDYIANYNFNGEYNVDPDYVIEIETSITYAFVSGKPTFTVTDITYKDTANANALVVVPTTFGNLVAASITFANNSSSCKSNWNYEAGLLYLENFNRETTVLTSENNTLFIPQQFSVFKNSIKLTINHVPPVGFDRYKVVIKAKPLQYQTIYVNEYYNEDNFVWAKLQAENKDKVNIGDELIVKKAGGTVVNTPIKVKVLDLQSKAKDFIVGNVDAQGNDIIETEGWYMKIRPNGFIMDLNEYRIHQREIASIGATDYPVFYLDLLTGYDGVTLDELKISQGSSIDLYINSNRKYDSGWRNITFSQQFFAQSEYLSVGDWMNYIVLNGNIVPGIEDTTGNTVDYKDNLEVVRGNISFYFGKQVLTPDASGKLYLKVTGLYSGGSKNRGGYGSAKIVIRKSTGFYAFETNPKQADSEIFYRTEQTFDVVNNQHTAKVNGVLSPSGQNQDIASFKPAIIKLDFFNCYSQGNGVESYKIKDGFNTNYLNIDLRPTSTLIDGYKKIRRYADLTYSESYVESSNQNRLNEFNISTGNFKELDKQYGSIQKLISRDGDVVVLQQEKASKVYFERDEVTKADGTTTMVAIDGTLGRQVFYLGENGVGDNPESVAINDYQIFFTNALRGIPQRLSMDGVTNISGGLVDYFRDKFIKNKTSFKIGGFDPYFKQYILTIQDEVPVLLELECNNSIYKTNIKDVFSYNLNLNNLVGNIVLNYNIINGNATITAIHNGITYVASNVNGIGNITIPRTDLDQDVVFVTITPVSEVITYEIANSCPVGVPMKIVEIIANDTEDLGKNIINRYRWGISSNYSNLDVFDNTPVTRFEESNGIEGVGKFPQRGEVVRIESFKDEANTGRLDIPKGNRIGFLVSSTVYTESDIALIKAAATFISISTNTISLSSFIDYGTFLFNRTLENQILYMIWDYVDDYSPSGVADFGRIDPTMPWTPGGSNGLNLFVRDNDVDIPMDWLISLASYPLVTTVGSVSKDINNTKLIFNTGSYPKGGDNNFNHRRYKDGNESLDINTHVAVGFDNKVFLKDAIRTGSIILHYYFGLNTGTASIEIAMEFAGSVKITYNGVDVSTIGFIDNETKVLTFPKSVSNVTCAKFSITTAGKWGVYSTIKP